VRVSDHLFATALIFTQLNTTDTQQMEL